MASQAVASREQDPLWDDNDEGNDNVNESTSQLALGWTRLSCCEDSSCPHFPLFEPAIPETEECLEGNVVFLLHESDPEWFQGYLLRPNEKPMGLLAEQVAVTDECLQCQAGGYRRLKLTVYDREHRQVPGMIEWTGGDMIQLRGKAIKVETQRLLSGPQALPFVDQLFGSIVRRLKEEESEEVDVLQMLPDLVVAIGSMQANLPVKEGKGG